VPGDKIKYDGIEYIGEQVDVIEERPEIATPLKTVPPVRLFEAEEIEEKVAVVDERSLPLRVWHGLCSALEWLFGVFSLLVGLAALGTIPIAQFLSLGYLLEASGRVSRSGRIRDGFVGVRKAARMGSLVFGTWLMLLPLRFVNEMWYSAYLIDAESRVTGRWRVGLLVLTVLMVGHILLAWYCGGRLRHFFWPLLAPPLFVMWLVRRVIASETLRPVVKPVVGSISPRLLADVTRVPPLTAWFPPAILLAGLLRGRMYSEARDAVCDFVIGLRLPHYFWLGVRGFAGAVAWLFVPIMLLIGATKLPVGLAVLAGLIGSLLLTIVLLYLPFMQAHFAAENRFVAMFELGQVRAMFRRAPIAFWFALLITLLFALPLYLLKIEYLPRETLGLPSAVFVAFIFPARVLTGWAVGRARKREKPRFFLFRWMSRLAALPVVGMYVLIVYLTQYLSWYGSWSLLEQHAFMLPAPFLGL
jgi:hypothetical protein